MYIFIYFIELTLLNLYTQRNLCKKKLTVGFF